MAIRYGSDFFVGAEQRADGRRDGWPEGYVTLKPSGNADRFNMTPEAARHISRQLKRFADAIDPPKPRRRRAA